MRNLFFNELLDEYNDQVDQILSDDEINQKQTYIFYEVYEVGGQSEMGECCDNMCRIAQCCVVLGVLYGVSSCCFGTNNYSGEMVFCDFEESCLGMGCSYCSDNAQDGGSALCCDLSFCCEGGCCDGYLCDCCC